MYIDFEWCPCVSNRDFKVRGLLRRISSLLVIVYRNTSQFIWC